jgi:ribosomal protein S18 acetylase RimI-like enzyme
MDDPNTLRPTPPDAAEAVAALLAAADAVETDRDPTTVDDVRSQWERPNFSLAEDSRIAGPAADLWAYTDVWAPDPPDRLSARFVLNLNLHPAQRGVNPALEDALVAWLEARVRQRLQAAPEGATGTLNIHLPGADLTGQALLARHGFRVEGESRIMRRELTEAAPTPAWPAGLTLRAMQPGVDERPAYDLVTAAFSDLPDFRPLTFEAWSKRFTWPTFEPRFWLLLEDTAGQLVGASMGFRHPTYGWIQQLAVRRAWRKQGLALKLLHQAFNDFRAAGVPAVELGVDAANATGAPRVYERAGMHIAQRFVRFDKPVQR